VSRGLGWLSRLHISSTCDAGCQSSHNYLKS
jgi:hypothetical protein